MNPVSTVVIAGEHMTSAQISYTHDTIHIRVDGFLLVLAQLLLRFFLEHHFKFVR